MGNRYGHLSIPFEIPKEEFETLIKNLKHCESDLKFNSKETSFKCENLLEFCYKLDENSFNICYKLNEFGELFSNYKDDVSVY